VDSDLDRIEEELGDALTRHLLMNDRGAEIVAALALARSSGEQERARELAAQLDIVEARRMRAMAIAQAASQHLNRLRREIQKD
jgi:hypothetical protein